MVEDFKLKVFIAVAQECSFTRAARKLGVSQPAVSQNIAELEKQIGVPLLLRGRSEVSLTEDGRAFREYAEQILSLYNAASCRFNPVSRLVAGGPLKVAADGLCSSCLMAPLIGEYEGTEFIINTYPSEAFLDETRAPSADILLYSAFPSGTLDFEDGAGDEGMLASRVGYITPALALVQGLENAPGVSMAVWEPYRKRIPREAAHRIVFSSSSVPLLVGAAVKLRAGALLIPRIAVPEGYVIAAETGFPPLDMEIRLRCRSGRLGGDALKSFAERLAGLLR